MTGGFGLRTSTAQVQHQHQQHQQPRDETISSASTMKSSNSKSGSSDVIQPPSPGRGRADGIEEERHVETKTTTTTTLTINSAAARSALRASSDRSLRVPCYCEENVWRLAYRRLHGCSTNSSSISMDTNAGHSATLSSSTSSNLSQQSPSLPSSSSASSSPSPSSPSSVSSWYVVFVSNPGGCVPMFRQLAAASGSGLHDKSKNQPVFWDYHVILIESRRTTTSLTSMSAQADRSSSTSQNSSTDAQHQQEPHAQHRQDDGNTDRTLSTIIDSSSSSSSPPSSAHETTELPASETEATTTTTTQSYVWDIDSLLPCPCPIEDYLQTSFHNHTNWPLKYSPYFRVIDAELYLKYFSSDRSHMLNPSTGEWSAQPPPYDCIVGMRYDDDDDDDDVEDDKSSKSRDGDTGTDRRVNTIRRKKTKRSSGDGGTYTMKQYMTISQTEVDEDLSSYDSIDDKRQAGETEPLGMIYSISQLRMGFGS